MRATQEGKAPTQIRTAIDAKYGREHATPTTPPPVR
jgi:hypothetical protein